MYWLLSWTKLWSWIKSWERHVYPIKLYKRWKRSRDKRIAERKSLELFWTYVICQAGENAVHAGQFSREQINQWYLQFGKQGLADLLPKRLAHSRKDQKDLKNSILKRIGPDARTAFKEKKSKRKISAKIIRTQFRRAFRKAANDNAA